MTNEHSKGKKKFSYKTSTSVTIAKSYVDYLTGQRKEVTSEHLKAMEEALSRRSLFHLIMSGIDRVLIEKRTKPEPENIDEELAKQLNMGLNFLESRINEYVEKRIEKVFREVERNKNRRDL